MSITVRTWFLLSRSVVEPHRKRHIAKGWLAEDAMTCAAEDALHDLRASMPEAWRHPDLRWEEADECVWFDAWDLGMAPGEEVQPLLLTAAREVFGHYLTPGERRARDKVIEKAMAQQSLRQAFELIARSMPHAAQEPESRQSGGARLLAMLDVLPAGPFLAISNDKAVPFGWPLIDLRNDASENRGGGVAVAIPLTA